MLVMGPKELPPDGRVTVWVDSGSGPGHEVTVPVNDLGVTDGGPADGREAIHVLGDRECDG